MKAFYESRQYDTYIKVWHKIYNNIDFVPHWHPEMEFIYIRSGTVQVTVDKKTVKAKEGDLIICDSGVVHYSNNINHKNSIEFLIFDPQIIYPLFDGFRLKNPLLTEVFLKNSNLYHILLNVLAITKKEKANKKKDHDELIASAIKFFSLLILRETDHLIDKKKKTEKKNKIKDFHFFLEYLEKNYFEEITAEDGAKILNVSKSYFSTLFKGYTGSTFTKYLNAIRIENSIIDIKNTDNNITEIAFSNGFNNIRTFNRVFKEMTRKTPSKFKYSSNIESDDSLYKVRKSSTIEYTDDFQNRTLIQSDD